MSDAQAVYRPSSYPDSIDPSRESGTNPFTTPHQSTPSIPLENLSSRPNPPELEVDLTAPENATSLPPADTGKAAWLFLAGATAIEVLIWGIPFSIGVLHAYWTDELFPGRGQSTITLASTLQTGLLYMVAALSGP
jgi:hypothetical protein